MAEGTRPKELQEALKKQEVLLVEERAQHNRAVESEGNSIQSNSTSFPKVEFPYFDGVDAKGWIRKCNWYFQVISTFPDDQKMPLASVHFQGKVEVWFQNFIGGRAIQTWEELVIVVMEHFDDVILELIETGSVQDYYEKFDDIKGQVLMFCKGLDEGYLTGSFISGLKEEIQGSVLASKPKNFQQTISLAKKFEKLVDALISLVGGGIKLSGTKSLSRIPQHNNSAMVRRFSNPSKPPFSTKVESNPPVKRLLTTAKMKARWKKNLYYICDETYTLGHRCKQRHLFMIMTEEEEKAYGEEIVSSEVAREEVMIEEGKVSLNALLGSMGEGAIRVDGVITGKPIQILIDSGSTHSFIDEKLAETLSFKKNTLTWSIHGLTFTHPVNTIKLGGCDMVLRCDLLRKQGKTKNASVQLISGKSLSKLLKKGTYRMYSSLCTVAEEKKEYKGDESKIEQLLKDFDDVF
ncbi:hypothetical protein CDL12_02189 [Handroanthus impetiginosus]|uniref:Retrotransposon gag domain-containing protein n=1 Tax=Handroanthus impetiginosus TaxID=429701 RepID=A0A2G9I5N2_9LAMI|nr:hypothetical protein CDL12_02189 [Handroanthus impetiginosus]